LPQLLAMYEFVKHFLGQIYHSPPLQGTQSNPEKIEKLPFLIFLFSYELPFSRKHSLHKNASLIFT
jgi:hypothetical protein